MIVCPLQNILDVALCVGDRLLVQFILLDNVLAFHRAPGRLILSWTRRRRFVSCCSWYVAEIILRKILGYEFIVAREVVVRPVYNSAARVGVMRLEHAAFYVRQRQCHARKGSVACC